MHESALTAHELTWRQLVEHHYSCLVDELASRLDSDLRNAVTEALASERAGAEQRLAVACDQARLSQAESLNQSLRRLRQAAGEEDILQILAENCAAYAQFAVVLVFENNQGRVAAAAGLEAAGLTFDIVSAPAVVSAIESRDPMVALASETELSPLLSEKLAAGDSTRNAYLFPLLARQSVVGMLIASGATPPISAPIELLCEATGLRLETLLPSAGRAKPAPLVQLESPASSSGARRLTWETLSARDQKLHLQAQRMARVRVAEMRLYHERELREGVAAADIYGALQPIIDSARHQFIENFLAKTPTMVDYLHLEILGSLAHDDDRLLGHNYPGPMV